jgi:hypothetical protein
MSLWLSLIFPIIAVAVWWSLATLIVAKISEGARPNMLRLNFARKHTRTNPTFSIGRVLQALCSYRVSPFPPN